MIEVLDQLLSSAELLSPQINQRKKADLYDSSEFSWFIKTSQLWLHPHGSTLGCLPLNKLLERIRLKIEQIKKLRLAIKNQPLDMDLDLLFTAEASEQVEKWEKFLTSLLRDLREINQKNL